MPQIFITHQRARELTIYGAIFVLVAALWVTAEQIARRGTRANGSNDSNRSSLVISTTSETMALTAGTATPLSRPRPPLEFHQPKPA